MPLQVSRAQKMHEFLPGSYFPLWLPGLFEASRTQTRVGLFLRHLCVSAR